MWSCGVKGEHGHHTRLTVRGDGERTDPSSSSHAFSALVYILFCDRVLFGRQTTFTFLENSIVQGSSQALMSDF